MARQHPGHGRTSRRMRRWTAADVPDQPDRIAVITGASSGIGYPVPVESNARSHDAADQDRLWRISEELTGVSYHITPAAALTPAARRSR